MKFDSTYWVASLLPPEVVKQLRHASQITDPKEKRIAIDEVTAAIRKRYPERMAQNNGR